MSAAGFASAGAFTIPGPHVLPSTHSAVLVVEDEPKLRDRLVAQLSQLGFKAATARSGFEAIRIASEQRPSMIFLDALLPEMHGFEIARFIRQIDRDYHPYIAIVTAIYKATRYQNEAKLRYGVDAYFQKPVQANELESALQQAGLR